MSDAGNEYVFRRLKSAIEIIAIILLVEFGIVSVFQFLGVAGRWRGGLFLNFALLLSFAGPILYWRIRIQMKNELHSPDDSIPPAEDSSLPFEDLTGKKIESQFRSAMGMSIVVIVGCLMLGLFFYDAIEQTNENSRLYSEIIEQKDLIADFLPPPEYIVESYLVAYQLSSPSRAADRELLESQLSKLSIEYEERHQYWVASLLPGQIKDMAVEATDSPARSFFRLVNERLIPSVRSGNYELAQEITNGPLLGAFMVHQERVNQLVASIRENTSSAEATRAGILSSSHIPRIASIAMTIVFITLGTIFFVFVAYQREVQRSIARAAAVTKELHDKTQSLKLKEMKKQAIFDSAFNLAGILDPDGNLLEANKAALNFASASLDAVKGKPFWETVWWARSEAAQAAIKDAVEQVKAGKTVLMETEHFRANGDVVPIEFSMRPVFDDAGELLCMVPEGRDKATFALKAALNDRLFLGILSSFQ